MKKFFIFVLLSSPVFAAQLPAPLPTSSASEVEVITDCSQKLPIFDVPTPFLEIMLHVASEINPYQDTSVYRYVQGRFMHIDSARNLKPEEVDDICNNKFVFLYNKNRAYMDDDALILVSEPKEVNNALKGFKEYRLKKAQNNTHTLAEYIDAIHHIQNPPPDSMLDISSFTFMPNRQ